MADPVLFLVGVLALAVAVLFIAALSALCVSAIVFCWRYLKTPPKQLEPDRYLLALRPLIAAYNAAPPADAYLDFHTYRQAQAQAKSLGVSTSEYIRIAVEFCDEDHFAGYKDD